MSPNEDGVVLVAAARTPVGRFNGALRHVPALDLGAVAVRAVLAKVDDAVTPDQVLLGNVVQAGNGQNPARSVAARGGIPYTVPSVTLNDVCLASMTSVAVASLMIRAGEVDTALVGGFESMSRALHGVQVRQAPLYGDGTQVDLLVHDGLSCALSGRGMGEMSDEANAALGISRRDQDEFATISHQRAAAATRAGVFADEIVPVAGLALDEGVRPDTTVERLAALRPAFTVDGTITAGNASQMSDAAAIGLVSSRGSARRHGLNPLVEVAGRAVVAGPDTSLHLKPAAAASKLLAARGMSPRDVDIWEVNEAFAGVVLASMRALDIEPDLVNVNGGAIALGHPLGASGFRLVMTLAATMVREQHEVGVAAICGGGGQGEAIMLRLAR